MSAPPRPAVRTVLPDAGATAALAERLAPHLGAGDTLLLQGELGAGKTHFARALIRARQRTAGIAPEEVPSPSFTLVQTYDAGGLEIWHADLYRLHAPDELIELGLDAAFDQALCLIEWPDRLGRPTPPEALHLTLTVAPGADPTTEPPRTATLHGGGPRHAPVFAAFIDAAAPPDGACPA